MDLPFPFPLMLALSPALVAILLALTTRRVAISLFAGVAAGAVVTHLDQVASGQVLDALYTFIGTLVDAVVPGLSGFELNVELEGDLMFGTFDGHLGDLDSSHLVITAFSLLVAGMVGILGRSGATRSLVRLVEGLAKGPRGAMVSAWLAGGLVFFDDYANCLVVGSAMGPVFDRFRVSRAKLAYIVDSTAAPVASLALVSTWVGYEVGLIGDELVKAGSEAAAFSVFLEALPYRFYGFVTLAMVGAVAISGKDFGPMLAAERAARREVRDAPLEDKPDHTGAVVALLTVGVLLLVTFSYLLVQGAHAFAGDRPVYVALGEARFFDIVGAADPFAAMFWGSLASMLLAAVLVIATRAMEAGEVPRAAWNGITPVFEALGVLFLAWALGNAMSNTGAADALSELIAPSDTVAFVGQPVDIAWHATEASTGGSVRVLDPGGQVVLERPIEASEPGGASLRWDGSTAAGAVAPAGDYRVDVELENKDGDPVKVLVRGEERFPAWLLPAVVFLVAAGTAFATGTSFGTMGILIPLAVPLGVWLEAGDPGPILLGSVAAVLAGAILGDHGSPISDTTVLSALGAGVDLVDHVRTQLPYALTAGAISLVVGYLPAGLGVSPWILIPIGCAMAVAVVWLAGKRSDPPKLGPLVEDVMRREITESEDYERSA